MEFNDIQKYVQNSGWLNRAGMARNNMVHYDASLTQDSLSLDNSHDALIDKITDAREKITTDHSLEPDIREGLTGQLDEMYRAAGMLTAPASEYANNIAPAVRGISDTSVLSKINPAVQQYADSLINELQKNPNRALEGGLAAMSRSLDQSSSKASNVGTLKGYNGTHIYAHVITRDALQKAENITKANKTGMAELARPLRDLQNQLNDLSKAGQGQDAEITQECNKVLGEITTAIKAFDKASDNAINMLSSEKRLCDKAIDYDRTMIDNAKNGKFVTSEHSLSDSVELSQSLEQAAKELD